MKEFSKKEYIIDKHLLADDLDVLKDVGKISHEIACDRALSEFEKYRVKQDKLYQLDFDKLLLESKIRIEIGFLMKNIINYKECSYGRNIRCIYKNW